ncbi:hypothetical protein ABZ786_21325, partial [Streptomyces albidoflavus]
MAEHDGDLATDQVEQHLSALGLREAGEARGQAGGDGRAGCGSGAADRGADQPAEQRRHLTPSAQRREVEADGEDDRLTGGQGRVEERGPLLGLDRRQT